MTTWLGIAWLRAVEVPVHTGYKGQMLEYTVNHVNARVAIIAEEFVEVFQAIRASLSPDLVVVVVGTAPKGYRAAADVLDGPAAVGLAGPAHYDISSILHTSGTTGASKGVLIPWAQAHASAVGLVPIEALGEHDVWYSPYPLFHAGGKIPVYAMALVNGSVVIREKFSGTEFWADILEFGCTTSLMIGASASLVAQHFRRQKIQNSPLRWVLVSPPPADPQAFEKEIGVRLCSVFNMTEISAPISTGWRQMTDRTCGKVRAGYECRVVDQFDEQVPDGEPGELIVRSDEPWTLNVGYSDMPEKTAEAWRNGWFHTGDMCVRSAEGEYYFVDRFKDAMRRRGENISSMEVEAMVVEHPAVNECAAYGVPAEYGEDDVKISITVADCGAFDPADLIDFLEPRMPSFMVPRYIEVLDELPRTPTEKVRKDVLRGAGLTPGTWDREASR